MPGKYGGSLQVSCSRICRSCYALHSTKPLGLACGMYWVPAYSTLICQEAMGAREANQERVVGMGYRLPSKSLSQDTR